MTFPELQIVISGVTASGKTALAADMAKWLRNKGHKVVVNDAKRGEPIIHSSTLAPTKITILTELTVNHE
jgi:tRNA uridine 5-carbamoylmethylation protein Kti12